jgi:hypothetical protein
MLALLIVPSTANGQTVETGFLNRTVSFDGTTYKYQVYVPAAFRSRFSMPGGVPMQPRARADSRIET